MNISIFALAAILVGTASSAASAHDAWIGQIKSVHGEASIRRSGTLIAAEAGAHVLQSDTVVTGHDGSLGLTFADDSMMSLGPDSVLVLDSFRFDSTTNEGAFATRLEKGTLAAKSGKIVKHTPESMTVTTPTAILAVRGTEFVVRAEGN